MWLPHLRLRLLTPCLLCILNTIWSHPSQGWVLSYCGLQLCKLKHLLPHQRCGGFDQRWLLVTVARKADEYCSVVVCYLTQHLLRDFSPFCSSLSRHKQQAHPTWHFWGPLSEPAEDVQQLWSGPWELGNNLRAKELWPFLLKGECIAFGLSYTNTIEWSTSWEKPQQKLTWGMATSS